MRELMHNEDFKAKLEAAEDLDVAAALFRNEGIQVTGSDLEAALEKDENGEELSEEALSIVAGGIAISGVIAGGIIIFVGGSLLEGYLDGIKIKLKKSKWFR